MVEKDVNQTLEFSNHTNSWILSSSNEKAFTSIPGILNADSWLAVPAGQHNAVWQNVIQAEKR